jgi:N-acetylmuramoyl-L-alanine amidase
MSGTGQDHIANAIFRAIVTYKNKIEKTKPADLQVNKKEPELKKEVNPTPAVVKNEIVKPAGTSAEGKKTTPEINAGQKNNVWYSVQIATNPTDFGVNNPEFKGLPKVSVYKHGGLYKYIVGKDTELSKSLELTKEMKNKGFKDAFVVAFRGDERITVEEAKRLLKNKQKK